MGGNDDLQLLMNQYNDEINNYQQLYQTYIQALGSSSTEISKSNIFSQLQISNDKMNSLNSQILYYLEQSEAVAATMNNEDKKKKQSIMYDYKKLENTRNEMNDKTKELEELKQENKNSEIVLKQYHSTYIFLIFIAIILVLLLIKISFLSFSSSASSSYGIQMFGGAMTIKSAMKENSKMIRCILVMLFMVILFTIIMHFRK